MVSIICLSECYNELKGDIGGSKQKEVPVFFFSDIRKYQSKITQ